MFEWLAILALAGWVYFQDIEIARLNKVILRLAPEFYDLNSRIRHIEHRLKKLEQWQHSRSVRMFFTVGGIELKEITMKISQNLALTLAATDDAGKPGVLDGAPAWAADAALATLVVADDGMSAILVPVMAGTVTVSASANSGGAALSASIDVVMDPNFATKLTLSAGEPYSPPLAA